MDEPKPIPLAKSQAGTTPQEAAQADAFVEQLARGSGHMSEATPVPPDRRERSEHSVMEGLPDWKAERVASMRRELADLQRQLIEAQQRIATELQGRADDAERFEDLETEITGLRSQLATVAATTEELRKDIVARDAQVEEARRQHRDVSEQLASLHEVKTLLATRDGELATRTTERDAEQANRSRLESELEDLRKQHREVSEQLDLQATSLRDAKAVIVTRDAELAAMIAERDAVKGELDQARRDLEAARTKRRDIANELVRLGQELGDGNAVATTTSEPKPVVASPSINRPQPPPMPQPRTAAVDTVLELSEPARSPLRTALLMLLGVIVGVAATIAIMKSSSASSTAASYREEPGVPAAAPPADDPEPVQAVANQPTSFGQNAPAADPAANEPAKEESAPPPAPPAEIATEGVILLPQSASGRRVFVDGKVVKVKSSKAVVACGSHKVRIGSDGTERSLDIACGAETTITE